MNERRQRVGREGRERLEMKPDYGMSLSGLATQTKEEASMNLH